MSSFTNFLRKNAALVAVMILTAIIVCILGSFVFIEWDKVQSAMDKINRDKEAVSKINAKRNPNPVDGSARMIQEDTVQLAMETEKLQRNFGKPYRGALLAFLKNMETKAPVSAEAVREKTVAETANVKKAAPANKEAVEVKEAAPAANKEAAPVKEASAAAPAKVEQAKEVVQTSKTASPAVQEAVVTENKVSEAVAVDDLQIPFSEDEVYKIFKDVYRKYYSDRKNASSAVGSGILAERAEIFDRFRAALTVPRAEDEMNAEQAKAYTARAEVKFDKCFAEFKKDVSAITCESVDDEGAKNIFLQALGLPRTMTTWDCKKYVDELHKNIGNAGIIPGINAENCEQNMDKIRAFTYDLKGKAPASQDNVVPIIRRFQMLEDMYRRMSDAKIASLQSVRPLNGLFGEPEDGSLKGTFIVFTYEIVFTSSLPEARDFINRMRLASDDVSNRVYLVRSFVVTKADAEEVVRAGGAKEIIGTKTVGKDGAQASETDPDAYVNAPDYGRPVIGVNDLVNVKMAFDYLIYVGDEVGEKF